MEQIKLSQIAKYLGINEDFGDILLSGIQKDNREIKRGDLFVAIRGENFDGHDFAKSAVNNGAAAVLCEREIEGISAPCLLVENTIYALQAIARGYREKFSARVVGITGSVGKTTTKEMIASVLARKYKTLKTIGNLNNEIGLPFTIFNMDSSHEAAVIEMGMNHFGEISRLTAVAKPDIAVISTIGESHIEFLGSKQGILKAKLEILEGLPKNGVVILNGDDELLWSLRGTLPFKTIYYGCENTEADIFGVATKQSLSEIEFTVSQIKNSKFKIYCGGVHNLKNALAAVAVGLECGLSTEQISAGLSEFSNTGLRQKIIEIKKRCVINDCYNANPDSMRAALNLLAKSDGRRIAVLADMLELGAVSDEKHRELGAHAKNCADIILVTGDMRECVVQGAEGAQIYAFEDVYKLSEKLKQIWREGDTILVKASRGMRLERVVEELLK